MTRLGPPDWMVRLLRALLPRAERDFVLGDLEEEFRARQARCGRARAAVRYLADAARSVWPLLTYDAAEGRGAATRPTAGGPGHRTGERYGPGNSHGNRYGNGWRDGMMIGLEKDLVGAVRVFRRAPGFAAVVVATLAIGVGGTTAVYSVIRGVLLSPLSFEDPDRVVMLWGQTPDYPRMPLTVGDHNALADGVGAFEAVTAGWGNNALILGEGEAEQVSVGWVTPEYFDIVGVHPRLGRSLVADDEGAILISHDLWVRRHGADPSIVGRTVQLPEGSFEIVGVLPPDRNPNLTTFGGGLADYDVWRLMPREWTQGEDRAVGWLRSTARLRDGVTLHQARAEVDALMTRVNETVTDRDGGTDLRVNLVPVKEDLVGGLSRTLWILLGAVVGVLLIAAANVAHLTLGRGEARSDEVAVRAALGGSRLRLVRQLLVESGVLALTGGLAGVAVAWVAVDALLALAPAALPRLDAVRMDWGVFVFALAATGAAALVFGLVPALRATRTDLAAALGERHGTGDRHRQRLSRGLVVAEVALSLALLTSTGLLLRSLAGLQGEALGFDKAGVVTFALEATGWGETLEEGQAKMTAYADRLRSVPGVQAAGFTNRIPLAGGLFTGTYRSEEMAAAEAEAVEVSVRYVTPGYFDAMGTRRVAGRGFRPEDTMDFVILDELAAEQLWPGENALGRRIHSNVVGEGGRWAEVVGVVGAMKHAGVADPAEATVYLPMLARAHQLNFRYAAVRVSGEPLAYVEPLREALRAEDANAVIARVNTLDELFARDVATTRFATLLLAVFGGVAMVLATVGLHGVMAYSVRRRSREIGIRVALGAEHHAIVRSAVGSGAALVVSGIVVGTALSLGSGRILQSVLFEVRPTDAVTLAGAAAVMLAVGLLGAWLPARLVLRMDPAVTLRQE